LAGQTGRQRRKTFVRSLEETAVRAVMTASVTFAVGWVLKRMFEKSVTQAAKEGAKDGVDEKVAETTLSPDASSTLPSAVAGVDAHPAATARAGSAMA
jgi:uncharacterized protein (DUF697 family)